MNDNDSRRKDLSLLLKASATPTSSSFSKGSTQMYSPVTDLAMNFSDLVTDGFNETPKRRILLSGEDGRTPGGLQMKPLSLGKQMSLDEGCSVDGLSPVKMESSFNDRSFGFGKLEENALEMKSSAFRRFKSMPAPFSSIDNSPPAKSPGRRARFSDAFSPPSPRTQRHQQATPEKRCSTSFFLGGGDLTPDKELKRLERLRSPDGKICFALDHDESSQDSGLGLEKDFKDKGSPFAKPLGPAPRRVRALTDDANSPHKLSSRSPSNRRSSTPDFSLHFSPGLIHKESPVKLRNSSLTLTPEQDDGDDGFLDLVDTEDQVFGMPSGMQGLFSNPVLSLNTPTIPSKLSSSESEFTPGLSTKAALFKENEENIKPKVSGSRRGLFRSPSAPRLFTEDAQSTDIRSRMSFKRSSVSREGDDTPVMLKRRRSVANRGTPEKMVPKSRTLQRSQSEALIKCALDTEQEDVIGDFSKPYCLPTIPGRHQDLRCITPHTMSRLLNNEFSHIVDKFVVVDSRYPYEFKGGHIQEALNIWERDSMESTFIKTDEYRKKSTEAPHKRSIIIFHCEFSSERGPKMSRFLRKMDREANKECYPSLYYPEMYLLAGGYKSFYEKFMDLCMPKTYKPMAHEAHLEDLKHFRAKSKSWAGEKAPKGSRTGLRQLKL